MHKRTQKRTKSLFVHKNADEAHKSEKTVSSVSANTILPYKNGFVECGAAGRHTDNI